MKLPVLPTTARRLALPGAIALAAVMGLAGPATAHVTIDPSTTETGGSGQVTFRVPNESDQDSTTRLQVTFPADSPLAFVAVRSTPGWKATVRRAELPEPVWTGGNRLTEAVSTITWTGGAIRPGEYQDFAIEAGPFPDRPTEMAFKALQTYSDGEVVRWIDLPQPGGGEPEHPAPVLSVRAASATQPVTVRAAPAGAAADGGASDTTGRVLGAAGLLAGLAALVLTLVSRRRPASQPSAAPPDRDPSRV